MAFVVGSTPDCARLSRGFLHCGLWLGARITGVEMGQHRNVVRRVVDEHVHRLRAHGREAAPTERPDLAPDTGQVIDRVRRFDAAVMARLSDRTGWFAAPRSNVHELAVDAVPPTLLPWGRKHGMGMRT